MERHQNQTTLLEMRSKKKEGRKAATAWAGKELFHCTSIDDVHFLAYAPTLWENGEWKFFEKLALAVFEKVSPLHLRKQMVVSYFK